MDTITDELVFIKKILRDINRLVTDLQCAIEAIQCEITELSE